MGSVDGNGTPTWSRVLGAGLIVGTIVSLVAAHWFSDSSFGSFSQSVGVPLFGLVVGAWLTDLYYRRDGSARLRTEVQKSAYTTLNLLSGVEQIDQSLADASNNLSEGKTESARSDVSGAIATATVSLRIAYQSIREWETMSKEAVQKARSSFELDENQIGSRQQIRRGNGGNNGSNAR